MFPAFLIFLQSAEVELAGQIFAVVLSTGLLVYFFARRANRQKRELDEARNAYHSSLSRLKSDPSNPDLRQRALQLGRAYSNVTRKKGGVTIFDEVALMNDINAACAGATALPGPQPEAAAPGRSIEERLTKLSELKVMGLIDEREYNARRQKILDEI